MGAKSLYVMFFPQLVAGPIERPQHLLPQFREEHHFDAAMAERGLRLIAWGLFKKLVIADRLGPLVSTVYNDPANFTGIPTITATVLFAFQIYCDFSGYSDIAIGTAQVLGFRLVRNFARPYFATSLSEFWRRWHISLSTWFRDYVYIPLGGGRTSSRMNVRNLLVTFSLSGFWHGAAWHYVAWGLYHGMGVLAGRVASMRHLLAWSPPVWVRMGRTFAVVCVGWVFFRARSMSEAALMLGSAIPDGLRQLQMMSSDVAPKSAHFIWLDHEPRELLLAVTLISSLLAIEAWQARVGSAQIVIAALPPWARWTGYYALAVVILLLGVFQRVPFIYFQF